MSNKLLENYIKSRVQYCNEIDFIFEHAVKSNKLDEGFIEKISSIYPTTTVEKILSAAIIATLYAGFNIKSHLPAGPAKIASKLAKSNQSNRNIPNDVVIELGEKIKGNNKELTPAARRAIMRFIGVDNLETEEQDIDENLENPLTLLFQELLTRIDQETTQKNTSDIENYEDLIQEEFGIEDIEDWEDSFLEGNNKKIVEILTAPLDVYMNDSEEGDLFSNVGYTIDRRQREELFEKARRLIGYLKYKGTDENLTSTLKNLFAAKAAGLFDVTQYSSNDDNIDAFNRISKRLSSLSEPYQEAFSKYIKNAAAFNDNNDNNEEY